MKSYWIKIEHFILQHTVWIFLSLFLLVSYLMQMGVLKNSWILFLQTFLKLSALFLPILGFAFFRSWLHQRLKRKLLVVFWSICFIFYPIALYLFGASSDLGLWIVPVEYFTQGEGKVLTCKTIGMNILATLIVITFTLEIALLLNKRFVERVEKNRFFQRYGLHRIILFSCGLAAVLLAGIGVIEIYEQKQAQQFFGLLSYFLSFAVQFFIIILIYYGYFWFNQNLLIPRILKKKGILFYGFAFIASILLFYPFFIWCIRVLPIVEALELEAFMGDQVFGKDHGSIPILIALLSVPVIVSTQWFKQDSQIAQLEKEKADTELRLLRQQINPHFYFNTLNNLYALSLTKDERTPEVIMQLSELMRYVIYKGKEATVLLKEEIRYIEDYVCLRQIRLHKQLDYRFEQAVENAQAKIQPLLFINLIENAFKHGIEPAEQDCFLHIHLKHNGKQLIFSCSNSFEENVRSEEGTGLNNLGRRLELLFPNRHSLETKVEQQTYTATIKISYR
ncbi:MAG: sensor histidine kinase [Bacteroidota bacterium]